jgi:hypothetical protein
MAEFRERVVAAEAELQRKLKYGLPIDDNTRRHRGRGPKPGDTIEHGGKRAVEW